MKVLLAITNDAAVREALRANAGEDDVLIAESSVNDAARRLIAIRADVLLLDDGPGLGCAALDTLHAAAPHTPIIVLSSRSGLATQAELRKAGADDVVIKPFSCETLRLAIERNMSGTASEADRPAPRAAQTLPGEYVLAQHQMALRWLSRATAQRNGQTALAERLAEGALDIFDAVRCAVLLDTGGRIRIAASHGISDSIRDTLSLDYGSGIMRCFDQHATLLERGSAPAGAVRELEVLGGHLAAPLLRDGRVFGALVLGEKAAAATYAREERELLSLVARSASLLFPPAKAPPAAESGSTLPEEPAAAPEPRKDGISDSRFWEYLSSRVAQEIKNPMVAINTFAQLLPRKYDSEEFRGAFSRVVQKEVQRINGVVETLFAFARHPVPERRTCSVDDTVRDALRSFEDELAARSITLETTWENPGTQAQLDPIYFTQAVHNLLQNAVEAMPAGGRIHVETRRKNGSAEIVVTDTGPGVKPGDEEQIFLPFYSTKERGMGLGLPIAHRIVQQHDGQLKVLRTDSGGGAFIIHLPAVDAGDAGLAAGKAPEQ